MDEATADPIALKSQDRTRDSLECDVCGGPTFERHCQVICRRCGYTRDCSDP